MELYYVLFSLVVSVSLPLLLLFRNHWSFYTASNLPPGRLGWPVIGESLAFLSARREGRLENFFFNRGWAHRAAFTTSLMGAPTVVLCGAAGNKFIFSNNEKIMKSWSPGSLRIFSPSGKRISFEQMKDIRKMFPGLQNVDALRSSIGLIDEIAQPFFADEWGGGGGNSVSREQLVKKFSFRVVARLLVSLDDPEVINRLQKSFDTALAGMFSIPVNIPGTKLNRALKAKMAMAKELEKVVKERKIKLAEGTAGNELDVLSQMLLLRTNDGPANSSELDVASWMIALFHPVHGPTSSACASIVKYLTELPSIYELVRNEQMTIVKSKGEGELLNWEDIQKMKYSWNVAQEALRLAPPAPGMFTESITDFTFGGFSIPKGWKIFWSSNATHKDPAYFPNPDLFDPSRFEGSGPAPHTFVPFGGGPRICPGKEYARAKILVFMHNLVKHSPSDEINVFG